MRSIVLIATASMLLAGLLGVLFGLPADRVALAMLCSFIVGALLKAAESPDE